MFGIFSWYLCEDDSCKIFLILCFKKQVIYFREVSTKEKETLTFSGMGFRCFTLDGGFSRLFIVWRTKSTILVDD